MSLPDQIAAYTDCFDLFERAQSSASGIRVLQPSREAAQYLRLRLNQSRVLERRESRQLYEPTDPRYNKSINDKYRVTLRDVADGETGHWVYIEEWAQTINTSAIEEL